MSPGTVGEVMMRAKLAQIDWSTAESLSEEALERALYGRPPVSEVTRPVPDVVYLGR